MENVICLLRFRSGRCGKQISVVTKLLHAYLTQTLSRHLMTVAIQKYSSRWISLWADEINCWQRQNTVWTQPDKHVGDAEKMRTIFCACVKINTMKITEEKRLSNKWNKKEEEKIQSLLIYLWSAATFICHRCMSILGRHGRWQEQSQCRHGKQCAHTQPYIAIKNVCSMLFYNMPFLEDYNKSFHSHTVHTWTHSMVRSLLLLFFFLLLLLCSVFICFSDYVFVRPT